MAGGPAGAAGGGGPPRAGGADPQAPDYVEPGDWQDASGASDDGEAVAGAATTSYSITGLVNTTAYEVQVAAVNRIGTGEWSDAASGTPAVLPAAPAAPSVVAGEESVTVTWVAPPDPPEAPVLSWRVRWRTAAVGADPQAQGYVAPGAWQDASGASDDGEAVAGASTTSYSITGLTNTTAYEVQVAAVNRIGTGEWSDAAPGTPAALPAAPAAPSVAAGEESVTVTWVAPADPDTAPVLSWRVRWRTAGDPSASPVVDPGPWQDAGGASDDGEAVAGASTTSYSITGLANAVAHEVQVAAVNRIGAGEWSDASAAVTPGALPEAPAVSLTAAVASLAVSWTAPADPDGAPVTGYRVRWRTAEVGTDPNAQGYAAAGPWQDAAGDNDDGETVAGASTTSYSITGLVNGTAYEVEVAAVNRVGDGPWSAVASGTPAALPVAPGRPAGAGRGGGGRGRGCCGGGGGGAPPRWATPRRRRITPRRAPGRTPTERAIWVWR